MARKKVKRPKCKACGKGLKKDTGTMYLPLGSPDPTRTEAGIPIVEITRREESLGKMRFGIWTGNWGGYGDGHFCGLTCGWRWAIRKIGRGG